MSAVPESMTASAPTSRVRVALKGFSAFERNALASYFRLAGDRFPAYEQTESLDDARFIVADADQGEALQTVQGAGRVGDTVFIGAHAPDGALGWMMRPIDPLHVLRELDAAVLMRQAGVQAPGAGTRSAGRAVGDAPQRRASDQPPPPRDVAPPVLIVDGDESAGRALERELQALGLGAVRVQGADKALELLGRLGFRYVFVDSDLADVDALAFTQQVKRLEIGDNEVPKVFVTGLDKPPLQQVRATFAGADAYLDKPVDEGVLRRTLSSHGALLARPGPMRALQR